ncbi:MAG: hypothetical protein JRE20_01790 [Deltaproteobacteria bacterium]|nr:hypothetical protein [Deltaproteobacteria bacterium]
MLDRRVVVQESTKQTIVIEEFRDSGIMNLENSQIPQFLNYGLKFGVYLLFGDWNLKFRNLGGFVCIS